MANGANACSEVGIFAGTAFPQFERFTKRRGHGAAGDERAGAVGQQRYWLDTTLDVETVSFAVQRGREAVGVDVADQ